MICILSQYYNSYISMKASFCTLYEIIVLKIELKNKVY